MRTLPFPRPQPRSQTAERDNASIRDSVRVLTAVVTQLSERIELLEAREAIAALYRPR